MIDFEFPFLLLAGIAVIVGLAIVNRRLAEPDGPTLADILPSYLHPPMPRVKEEDEPARWQVERLHPYPYSDRTNGAPVPTPHTLAHPAGGAFGIGTGHSR